MVSVLVAIDHYSRKVMAVVPLEGPNAGWVIQAVEDAFKKNGRPKYVITDKGSVFRSDAFKELLESYNVKHRFGAVGKHGSIAVVERVIETLKYEWLNKVACIRVRNHLEVQCASFIEWYNEWRPHMFLEGNVPEDRFTGLGEVKAKRHDKRVSDNIERKVFADTRTIGYRLKEAA